MSAQPNIIDQRGRTEADSELAIAGTQAARLVAGVAAVDKVVSAVAVVAELVESVQWVVAAAAAAAVGDRRRI